MIEDNFPRSILTMDVSQVMAMEVMCMIDENFPMSILTNRFHMVFHLVDGEAICGVVHA